MGSVANQIRKLLAIGFGGVLLLLAFTGLNGLSVLRKIQSRNAIIREDYLNRDRILEQLRSNLYLSGTYVRDLLLEPDPGMADAHRRELNEARARIQRLVAEYTSVLRADERGPVQAFREQVLSYFDLLRPALAWNAKERRRFGYRFMKDSLLPRRMIVVHLADRISSLNQQQLEAASRQVSDLFADFRESLIFLLVLTLIVGTLLASASVHRILRLERASESASASLRDLSGRLLEAQESERRALSRELHDEVGQSLSALLLGIGSTAAAIPPETNPEALSRLQELRSQAEQTVAEVRDMSLLLRPSMLDDLGLIPALEWQAREVSRTSHVRVDLRANGAYEALPDLHKTCIYRVVQEALRNVTRHAGASNVAIELSQMKGKLCLTIQDDGHGFNPAREKGMGVLGMEERVTHLGGKFRLRSEPSKGTLISVQLPLAEHSTL